ncbi:MAG: TetR/AcrR family transcriptional regulator [Pseudomonas sp.]|uniref:TetR/AcrR family transcriptional regulator n=1 Tax=Pseudomonas abieticivorans TaxID=2931382 RepID=UPI0020BD4EB6|nr:TetR/AcrR family transcriptional regulator [Pseudomonas sp. PIA16]MDE1165329.1 TetR/AcrR family transcriptional regulator [Pseudomonas sp.]
MCDVTSAPGPFSRAGKRAKRVEQINEAAARVFIRDGHGQFSARKVAKELGISLNNLQHYCGNTQNLCLQMITARLAYFVQGVDRLVADASPATPLERLAVAIRENSAATLDADTARFFFQVGALASYDPAIKAQMARQYDSFLEGICQLVADIDPQLPAETVRTYAALIATQIDGNFFYQDQLQAGTGQRERLVEAAINLWANVLAPRV